MSLIEILSVDCGRKVRRRIGRGPGSNRGKTCGRGQKGEGARSGGKNRGPLFEGGQFPFWMRLPKRGFSNYRHTCRYQAVGLKTLLERIEGDEISIDDILDSGLADESRRIKIVSGETIERKLKLTVHRATKSVCAAIEAAGGTVEQLDA